MKRFRSWSLAALVAMSSGCASNGESETTAASSQSVTAGSADVALTTGNDWGGGYCSDVKIKNSGTSAITGWTVIISLGGSTFSNGWSATTTVSGGNLTATPAGYNASIAPGQSVSFGFCGASTSSTQRPTIVSATVQGGGSAATGGAASTGGSSAATGGTKATGGTSATGGTKATGGTSATGGTKATGGTSATGGTKATGGTVGVCAADYAWPTYSPAVAYDYANEYGAIAMPTAVSNDVTGIAGTYADQWWSFIYGSKKNSLVTAAAWVPMVARFNTDFAYITDTMRWPRDGRARSGKKSAIYLYGSGLSTDSASNTELGGWQSGTTDGPMVLASYYPVYSFNPACTYSDKAAQQGAMIHEGIHAILASMPGCKNAAWFHEGGNTWLQSTMESKRSGTTPTSMGWLSAGAALAPFMPIETYTGWLLDGSFGGPAAERVNQYSGSQQLCTWRKLLGGTQYGETFPHAMEVILGEKSIAWVWRNASKSGRVLQDLAEVTGGLGTAQTRRLIQEYRARQAFGDFGKWKAAYKKLLNDNWGATLGCEWTPCSVNNVAAWIATTYVTTTQSGTTLTPDALTLPGWSGANQIPLTLSSGAACATVTFNPTGANMSCQLVYQDTSGNVHYGTPVTSGACTIPVSNVKNNVVIAVVSNTNYIYDGGTTKYGYTVNLGTGISGKASTTTQWYK